MTIISECGRITSGTVQASVSTTPDPNTRATILEVKSRVLAGSLMKMGMYMKENFKMVNIMALVYTSTVTGQNMRATLKVVKKVEKVSTIIQMEINGKAHSLMIRCMAKGCTHVKMEMSKLHFIIKISGSNGSQTLSQKTKNHLTSEINEIL